MKAASAAACRRARRGLWAALALESALLLGCDGQWNGGDAAAAVRWRQTLAALARASAGAELWLSEVGVSDDFGGERAADLHEFEPAYTLWSDGLNKRRWLRLPRGTHIDSSDMDHWRFPPGTLLFKEFSSAERRIETRLIARTAAGERDYWMGAFVWNDDESDARFVPGGERHARGTAHDVPAQAQCGVCHNGEPGRALGFSAIQQPRAPAELLSAPLPQAPAVRGDAGARAALGYLHANCAHCHNPRGSARPDTDMDLSLSAAAHDVHDTRAYQTAVSRPLQHFRTSRHRLRVAPGAPEWSGLLYRMTERGTDSQMPPLGSEVVDRAGVALVRAWIDSL